MARVEETPPICAKCGTAIDPSWELECVACLLNAGCENPEDADLSEAGGATEQFGSYTIVRRDDGSLYELGRGAMGLTYRALDTSLNREVALKIIRAGIGLSTAESRERFMREARAAASLRHPNVATVYQFGIREETGQCFCAMELIDGETLEDLVRRCGPVEVVRSRAKSRRPCWKRRSGDSCIAT
jgi:hypothetical protein